MPERGGIIRVEGFPFLAGFRWSVGKLMERFIKELANKKIFGTKCSKCGYTYVPPRSRCGRCHAKMAEGDLTELPGKGTLESFTVAHVELDGAGNFLDLDRPKVIGAIKLDDADSIVFFPVEEIDPKELKEKMRVEIVWREEPKGEIADIRYFKPLRG